MHAASREALGELRRAVDSAAERAGSGEELTGLAEQIYSVAALLGGQPRLRRWLADPAISPEQRAGIVARLLEQKVGAATLEFVTTAVQLRWSGAWDLVDALETSADGLLLAAADRDGTLDDVEDELFRFERVLDAQSALTTLLDEATASPQRRVELLESVVAGKMRPVTVALLRQAVATSRTRSILIAVDRLIDAAGARRERSVARVVSAVDLTDDQQERLAARLTQLYGRPIQVRYAIDPSVRGGLVVRVGDELIDGSIASRLAQIRNAFAG